MIYIFLYFRFLCVAVYVFLYYVNHVSAIYLILHFYTHRVFAQMKKNVRCLLIYIEMETYPCTQKRHQHENKYCARLFCKSILVIDVFGNSKRVCLFTSIC